jgi:hypothetical protein
MAAAGWRTASVPPMMIAPATHNGRARPAWMTISAPPAAPAKWPGSRRACGKIGIAATRQMGIGGDAGDGERQDGGGEVRHLELANGGVAEPMAMAVSAMIANSAASGSCAGTRKVSATAAASHKAMVSISAEMVSQRRSGSRPNRWPTRPANSAPPKKASSATR